MKVIRKLKTFGVEKMTKRNHYYN